VHRRMPISSRFVDCLQVSRVVPGAGRLRGHDRSRCRVRSSRGNGQTVAPRTAAATSSPRRGRLDGASL
jgi:hypothetical protein